VRALRRAAPPLLLAAAILPGSRRRRRGAAVALAGVWAEAYRRYRARGLAQADRERVQLAATDWDAFRRHYAHVPTLEEELDIWGPYDRYRHEMRYRVVGAAAARHLPPGGRVVEVGCGSAKVADGLRDAHYVGVDFGWHQVSFAAKARGGYDAERDVRVSIAQGTAERLPLADGAADAVVMTEVIEHLLRPDEAVWEVARVLRRGGVLVLSTNNASEVPLCSPLTNPLAWAEKAVGWDRPEVVSTRPWVWPEEIDPGNPARVPHTHHVQAETRRLLAAAGLTVEHASSFEFPPPQSRAARWLGSHGERGLRLADALEAACHRTPLLSRMGTHLFLVARKTGGPVAPEPPPGLWSAPSTAA
jgi:SAM-dependent methyltransferase